MTSWFRIFFSSKAFYSFIHLDKGGLLKIEMPLWAVLRLKKLNEKVNNIHWCATTLKPLKLKPTVPVGSVPTKSGPRRTIGDQTTFFMFQFWRSRVHCRCFQWWTGVSMVLWPICTVHQWVLGGHELLLIYWLSCLEPLLVRYWPFDLKDLLLTPDTWRHLQRSSGVHASMPVLLAQAGPT